MSTHVHEPTLYTFSTFHMVWKHCVKLENIFTASYKQEVLFAA